MPRIGLVRSSFSRNLTSVIAVRKVVPDCLWLTAVALVVASVWMVSQNRVHLENWKVPLTYQEDLAKADVLWLLAGMKAAEDGHLHLFQRITIPELGAPLGAKWDDFPWTEKVDFILPGVLARWIGLFAALNVSVLVAHLLAGAAFYISARLTRITQIWSATGAAIFALSRYAFAHGAHHLNITLFWHVPLALLVCRWISEGDGLQTRGARFWLALGIGVVTGAQNIYYTNMFLQLAGLGALAQWLRRGWRPAWPALVVCATAVATILLMNINTLAAWGAEGYNGNAIVRFYQSMEFYALKLTDLIIAYPDHRLFGYAAKGYFKNVLILGELPPPSYVGLVGIAGLVWLSAVIFAGIAKRNLRRMPLEAAQIGWILLYSVVGGLNGLLGAVGLHLFRATTRYSIFILALVLLFLFRRLSELIRNRPMIAAPMAIGLVSLAIWDQVPPFTTDAQVEEIRAKINSDEKFTREMEARLSPGGMVFELPVIDFPERFEGRFAGYQHFRPYLYSHGLRYSFGTVKGRPRQDWAHDLDAALLSEEVTAIERYGFGALLINTNAFPGKAAEIDQAFRALDRGEVLRSESGELLCVFLEPSANPVLPERPSSKTNSSESR